MPAAHAPIVLESVRCAFSVDRDRGDAHRIYRDSDEGRRDPWRRQYLRHHVRRTIYRRPSERPLEARLKNVVEEMAIAAGVKAPCVCVLDNEPCINAFAAGVNNKDPVIGVTVGCLTYLTRDELQAIVAHEFSHILNNDDAQFSRLCPAVRTSGDLGNRLSACHGRFRRR